MWKVLDGDGYDFIICMILFKISFIFGFFKRPGLERMIAESAVNIRLGLTEEFWGNPPDAKSVFVIGTEYPSALVCVVIWHKITSSPIKLVTTKAGLFLAFERSEKGKGTTTTSPFTNFAMPHPLRVGPNLSEGHAQMPTSSDKILKKNEEREVLNVQKFLVSFPRIHVQFF